MARKVSRQPQRKLSTVAWFAIGCGSTLALGLIALLVALTMLSARPAPPPEARATTSDTPAAAPPAPPLEQQLSQAQQLARSGQAAQVSLVIRQDELNALIQRESPGDVRNLRVYFGSGSMAATGDVTWRGRTIPITTRGTPVVSGERVQVQVSEVKLGTLQAPESVRARIESDLQRGIEHLAGGNRMRVRSVSVSPGVMIVQGWVGPQ